jgi:hypothetical protein
VKTFLIVAFPLAGGAGLCILAKLLVAVYQKKALGEDKYF